MNTLSVPGCVNGDLLDQVKHAASGCWAEILERVGGVPADILDGKHHPCPKCGGTNRFRVFADDTGGAICNQCFNAKNGDGIATLQWLTGDDFRTTVDRLADYLDITRTNGHAKPDLLTLICRSKRMPIESAKAYGARITQRGKMDVVRFPVVNEAGEHHSDFDLTADGGKGWFAKGNGKSGLFLPIVDGKPRLPQAGETWIVCEGVKDAAAYHSLRYLACGTPSDHLAIKYARLFRSCNVVVMPDRTTDAEAKALKSAAGLFGVAASVRVGTLPLEIGGSKDDARDVIAIRGGETLLKRAIDDAEPWEPPKQNGSSVSDPSKTNGGSEATGEAKVGLTKRLADAICQRDDFAQDAGGRLYRYNDGAYRVQGDRFVKRQVKCLLEDWGESDKWSRRQADEVVEYIRLDSPELWERPPLDIVNLSNGLLDTSTRTLRPHSPLHLSPIQLPIAYDSSATCPATDQFVSEVFPNDARDLAWEIVAWLMLPDTSIQKAVLLIGEGGNGKSTWLAQVVSFLGKANTSAVPLHRLEADKFAASRLLGKLANICPDLPSEHLSGTSNFKSLTGGDVLQGEYKFRDSFDFTPFARLVFSANHPPRSEDASTAFFDRWIVIPFDRRYRGEQVEIPRAELDARLSTSGELSGLLNHALDAMPRLRRQRGFSLPPSVQAACKDFHATTDPLAVWMERNTVDDPDAVVPKAVLRTEYGSECERRGRPPMSETAFGRAFKALRPTIELKQRTVNGRLQWCYIGIGLRDEGE